MTHVARTTNHQDYKGKSVSVVTTKASLLTELNTFYVRFEADNTESSREPHATLDDKVLSLSQAIVPTCFKETTIFTEAKKN